jgi:hypothetical protein
VRVEQEGESGDLLLQSGDLGLQGEQGLGEGEEIGRQQ